jgi:hypothetical protein
VVWRLAGPLEDKSLVIDVTNFSPKTDFQGARPRRYCSGSCSNSTPLMGRQGQDQWRQPPQTEEALVHNMTALAAASSKAVIAAPFPPVADTGQR